MVSEFKCSIWSTLTTAPTSCPSSGLQAGGRRHLFHLLAHMFDRINVSQL